MKHFIPIVSLAIALSGCGTSGTSQAEESFIAGSGAVTIIKESSRQKAPAISGMTLSGNNYSFAGGQVAVVNVWASWCSPCRAEEPVLSALAKKYQDVAFIGILTRDNPVNAEAFARKRGIPYPTIIDDSILVGFSKSLPANAIPTTLVIDRNGGVAARVSGAVTVASLTKLIEDVSAE
jgi:thiol-disulfide isomerase/thioredoxin